MTTQSVVFIGTADAYGSVRYVLPATARRAIVAKRFAGEVVEVEIRGYHDRRSDRQSRAWHAMVTPWAKERGWALEALKQFLLKAIFGTIDFADPKTGEIHAVLAQPHTARLTVHQFSELIERTLELAAEDGLWLDAPDEYTKRTRRR